MKLPLCIITMLALIVLSFAACGGKGQNETTAESAAGETTEETKETQLYQINKISALNQTDVTDSHAAVYNYSTLEKNYRESKILRSYDLLSSSNPMYPRVKRLNDGRYFLLFMNGQYGSNIMYALSDDGVSYGTPILLFSDKKILNGTDTRRYMTADAAVLQNGDILVVSSYRAVNGYRTMVSENGLVTRRSTDGGKTWGEEKIIYVGTNWEPYIFQLKSGEIHVYMSSTAEKIYLYGYSDERISSGIGLLRSYDNGETWTPAVDGPPFAPHMVMKQYVLTRQSDGVMCFTDQMASAVELHNGSIALVGESRLAGDVYKISVGITYDNWAVPLGFDEAGPLTRVNNMFLGAGPYLSQFASGETLLTYNSNNKFYARLGSSDALSFASPLQAFNEGGFWGSCFVDSGHSALLTVPSVTKISDSRMTSEINIARFYLNHDIDAQPLTPVIDGGNEEWVNGTDALFIGSDSQAQVSFRFACDSEYIYILAERLDYHLTTGDSISFLLDSGDKTFFDLKVDLAGLASFEYFDGTSRNKKTPEGIEAAIWTDGTADNQEDTDRGAITEIKIPRRYLTVTDGKLKFFAAVYNKDSAGSKLSADTFSLASNTDKSTWQRVNIPS